MSKRVDVTFIVVFIIVVCLTHIVITSVNHFACSRWGLACEAEWAQALESEGDKDRRGNVGPFIAVELRRRMKEG